MPELLQSTLKNRLLAALSPSDFDLLQPHLQSVVIKVGDMLIQANMPITRVCFVEQGIVSCIALSTDGRQTEIGLVGCEGMTGVPVLLHIDRTPNEARVQTAGWAWSLDVGVLRRVIQGSPSLHAVLLRYVQIVICQTASIALANSCYNLRQRLARWLLMCQDRSEGNLIAITHYSLSQTLGVTRTSLSPAVAILQNEGIISGGRGKITIRDRDALRAIAGASYGAPEREYARLIEEPSTKSLSLQKPRPIRRSPFNAA